MICWDCPVKINSKPVGKQVFEIELNNSKYKIFTIGLFKENKIIFIQRFNDSTIQRFNDSTIQPNTFQIPLAPKKQAKRKTLPPSKFCQKVFLYFPNKFS